MLRFIVIPQCDKSIFFFKERKKINLKDMNINNIVGLSWVVALALGITACTKNDTSQTATAASSSHATSTNATSANAISTHASMTQAQSMHHMASTADTQSQSQPPHIMAYMDIMNKMRQAMSAGVQAKNADIAFAKGIIPHHQGAIDMATIEQTYGKDPAMLALAKQIKHAQTPEIKQMQDWLSKQAH